MDSVEVAVALKSLQQENASLKILLRELEDATRFKREQELVESAKANLTGWAKRIAAVFTLAATVLGVSTFLSARDAAVSTFQKITEPKLRQIVTEEMLPQIKRQLESDAARRVDEFTSAGTKQFDQQMNVLFDDLAKYARNNNFPEPERPVAIDAQARPMSGYVLKAFLTHSVDDTYLINTFRLNVRDAPGGTIIGRQVQNARVKITEHQGDWGRIEVQ